MRKLKPTAPKLYRFRKVIRKPNPTKIITWTSWKPRAKVAQGYLVLGWCIEMGKGNKEQHQLDLFTAKKD